MPEKIHKRFDAQLSQTKEVLSKPLDSSPLGKKRKRGQSVADAPYDRLSAKKLELRNEINRSISNPLKDVSTQTLHEKSQSPTAKPEKLGSLSTPLTSGKPHVSLKEKANALWQSRKLLPVWSHSEEIRNGLKEKDVMLLVGETGSGKSTQVPQMLVGESWCRAQSVRVKTDSDQIQTVKTGGCIAITEPRRVAAISLARRVSEEMGTPLGSSSPASKVGYSVRFDNSTSPCTQIKFLTEGMLLQEMLRDPWLRQYSAVVVDEVHERGVNVDLVMGFLRNMNASRQGGRGGIPLKVVVMSATADMDSLLDFFEEGYRSASLASLPKHESSEELLRDDSHQTDDDSEWSGISSSDDEDESHNNDNQTARGLHLQKNGTLKNGGLSKTIDIGISRETCRTNANGKMPDKNAPLYVAICHIEGRQYHVKTIYSPEPVQDFVDASLRLIFQIHYKEPMPGDILVFLTGQETVESLESSVNEYALSMGPDVPKILALPLFAALPQTAQQRVFQPAPAQTRKVILATNIAETSVTVSGVRFVIDCGKAKTKQHRSKIGLDSLLVKPISKSAATQRKGRAGRESPGQCYRLYTEQAYRSLPDAPTPEILRCDLSQALLGIKAHNITTISAFPFLSPPPRASLETALTQLFHLQALHSSGAITPLGQRMARLPLSAPLARVLLAAAAADPRTGCLAAIIDIIACLSVESIFLQPAADEHREAAETARRELHRREGDHLTMLATVQAYAAEQADRKAWAERHFVSHRAMQAVMVTSLPPSSPSIPPT